MDFLKTQADKSFDLAIVDSPYGEGAQWNSWFRTQYGVHGRAEYGQPNISGQNTLQPCMGRTIPKISKQWGERFTRYSAKKNDISVSDIRDWDIAPPYEYFQELFRVSKNQIIWGGNYFDLPPTRCFIVWRKLQIPTQGFSMSCVEYAWSNFNKNALYFECFSNGNSKYQRIHPTQKPVKLYEFLLQNFAKPGDKILDTHVGSGSIRIACHDLGFDFTGCEISKDYFDAQESRFKKHCEQGNLFEFYGGQVVD